MTIKGFIFDFDGLILDTEMPNIIAWQEIYQKHQVKLPYERLAADLGTIYESFDPFAYLEQQTNQNINRDQLMKEKRSRTSELILGQPVLPGVKEYLTFAHENGLKVGLASSSDRRWINDHLRRIGLLDQFDCIFTSDDVKRAKPSPDLYLANLTTLGLNGKEAVVFEDAPMGIKASKAAGTYCVAVANQITRDLNLSQADIILNSFKEKRPEEIIQYFNTLGMS
jgi:HAD superfamily hydrolase (TIGR01509 family)